MLISLPFTRRFSRVVAALFAAAAMAALIGIGAPASAHSVLLGTDPDDEEQLAAAPDEVSLTFNEDITDLGTEVVITTEDGDMVSDGEVVIDGPVVTQALVADRPEGAYTVTWRAVSADGHPISGEFMFTAAEATTDGEAAGTEEGSTEAGEVEENTQAPEDDADTPDEADDAGAQEDSEGLSASTWVIIGVLIVAAIILVTVLARGMSSSKRQE